MLSVLFGSAAGAIGLANADARDMQLDASHLEAQPLRSGAGPMSRAEGRESAESAVAGALVGVASQQFADHRVRVRLVSLHMQPTSPRDRDVQGTGWLQLDDDRQWLPFRYRALFDTETQTAGWATLTLTGNDGRSEKIPTAGATARSLLDAARERIGREFPQQRVELQLADVQRQAAGRYQRYIATGSTRIHRQAPVRTRFDGLFDPATGRWVRIEHELGETVDWQAQDFARVASMVRHP